MVVYTLHENLEN